MSDLFPPSFNDPARLDEVVEWVATLPLDAQDKKRMLLDWAARVGVVLTGEQVRTAIPELARDEGAPP